MRQEKPRSSAPLGPLELRRKVVSFEPSATSDWLGWVGLEAARYCAAPASDYDQPALTHHMLILYTRPPRELDLWYEGVKRAGQPSAGSVTVVPAGSQVRWRWSGSKDSLHIYLEPDLVTQVAAEAFDLDPARITVPPLNGLDLPQLRAAMLAVDAELTADGAGGRLAAESLANVLAVHLIRHVVGSDQPALKPNGALPRGRLRAVVEYVEDHLDADLSLRQIAAVAHLSAYHFARQFKAATGLSPHQYVILRRVERAEHLLQGGGDLSLAEVACSAGFTDQSQFSHHFKRRLGVTPGQFRLRQDARKRPQGSARNPQDEPLTILDEQDD
jgi:AraC family transcriptional regulator